MTDVRSIVSTPHTTMGEQGPADSAAELLSSAWMTTEELAVQLKVDASTVRRWRTSRPPQGPPFVKLSGRVTIYNVRDVEGWLGRHRVVPGDSE